MSSRVDIKPALRSVINDLKQGYALPADLGAVLEAAWFRIVELEAEVGSADGATVAMQWQQTGFLEKQAKAPLEAVDKFFNFMRHLGDDL